MVLKENLYYVDPKYLVTMQVIYILEVGRVNHEPQKVISENTDDWGHACSISL